MAMMAWRPARNGLGRRVSKGEHIFVSDDDWNRLRGIFNFSGIPFGVLIGKDGKVIKTKHVMTDDDPLLKKALSANVAQ